MYLASLLRFALPVAITACAGSLVAQDVPAVRAKTFEIGGFVGSSYGLDDFRVMGGGNATYAVTKYILPYFEYSYFPGFQRTNTGPYYVSENGVVKQSGTQTEVHSLNLSDLHAGVHIRVPIFRESHLVPYGVFGAGGLLYAKESAKITINEPNMTPRTNSATFSSGPDFAVNFGGGLRYYVKQNWGVRAEAKVYKPTGLFTDVFGKVEFGVFIQLGK